MDTPQVEIRNLSVRFPLEDGVIHAVQDVSLTIPCGGTVGIVGESGSGKTVTGLSLLRLVPPPGVITAGEILYRSRSGETLDLVKLPPDGETIRRVRGREIAMIFQEPMTSLTPVYTVGQQIIEMIRTHEAVSKREGRDRAVAMLRRVHMPGPEQRVDEYPHQLSGGMRQRVMIAMALSCSPTLLIADEPTTALDVTVQAQILDLLQELRESTDMAILIISHDLGVIAALADQVAVMYAGQIVEHGPAKAIFYDPRHPYTQGLLKSAPVLGRPPGERLTAIRGSVPSLRVLPKGCAFRPRCDFATEACREPQTLEPIEAEHLVRCCNAAVKMVGVPVHDRRPSRHS